MKIAIVACLLAKRNMYINARQRFLVLVPILSGYYLDLIINDPN
jgi:hypothetical protein